MMETGQCFLVCVHLMPGLQLNSRSQKDFNVAPVFSFLEVFSSKISLGSLNLWQHVEPLSHLGFSMISIFLTKVSQAFGSKRKGIKVQSNQQLWFRNPTLEFDCEVASICTLVSHEGCHPVNMLALLKGCPTWDDGAWLLATPWQAGVDQQPSCSEAPTRVCSQTAIVHALQGSVGLPTSRHGSSPSIHPPSRVMVSCHVIVSHANRLPGCFMHHCFWQKQTSQPTTNQPLAAVSWATPWEAFQPIQHFVAQANEAADA